MEDPRDSGHRGLAGQDGRRTDDLDEWLVQHGYPGIDDTQPEEGR